MRLSEHGLDRLAKFGSANSEEAHLASEGLFQLAAYHTVQNARDVLVHPAESLAAAYGRQDAGVDNLFNDERHAQHNGRLDYPESLEQCRRCKIP